VGPASAYPTLNGPALTCFSGPSESRGMERMSPEAAHRID
jgi:hypothetical protein